MKKNNKGFSLVELIIVIAIMAILAGALAPALIKYINKSRRSTDISNADTIRTACQTAMSDEDAMVAIGTGVTGASVSDGYETNFAGDRYGAGKGAYFGGTGRENQSFENVAGYVERDVGKATAERDARTGAESGDYARTYRRVFVRQ